MNREMLIDISCGVTILGAMILLLVSARIGQPLLAVVATSIAMLTAIFQVVIVRRRNLSRRAHGPRQGGAGKADAEMTTCAGRF
jgi:hypothetical protein